MYTPQKNALKSLFSSQTRIELLRLFLLNPEQSYYLRQIQKKTSLSLRAVQRELANLCNIGLLAKNISGNRNYYVVNKECPLTVELKNIILKSTGISEALKQHLKNEKDIDVAFIYGSYAKDKENLLSDIDLFVIGNISSRRLSSILSKEKSALGREINFNLYAGEDFIDRLDDKNHFILSVLKDKKIFVIGDTNGLKAICRRR